MMHSKKSLLIVITSAILFVSSVCAPVQAQQPGPQQQGASGTPGVQHVARGTGPLRVNPLPQAQLQPQPLQPAWIPLAPAHQKFVNQVLAFWEFKSNKIKRYRCNFKRWDYDPVFGPKNTFKTYGEGVIKYSAPDKGLFRVESLVVYQPPRSAGEKPQFTPAPKELFECWICDGEWVYQYDFPRKRMVQTQLPPEMRGEAIGQGPLPFLFNAKADDIQRRFWVRNIMPEGVKGEYHLEAIPKNQDDAGNFKMIHIIIDEKDYLPKAMVVFDPDFPRTPKRTSYEFADREVNFNILAAKLNLFHREFFEPAVPKGWQKDVRKWAAAPAPSGGAAATASNPAAAGSAPVRQ